MSLRHVMEPSVTESHNHFTTLPGSGGVPGATWGLKTVSALHAWKTLILLQVQLAVPGCRKTTQGFSVCGSQPLIEQFPVLLGAANLTYMWFGKISS